MTTVKDMALAVGNRVGVKVIPRLPNAAKRLLSGGRAVSIDGNTLDPSIQMLLAAQRATGVDSLVVANDHVATRASNRALTRTLDEPDIRVADISAGVYPRARRCHPGAALPACGR